MQETVARQINYAVSSFPKQSLDEWILEYPQQVILTTIHLILSHEINELLEEMTEESKRKHLNEGEFSDKNDDDSKRGDDDDEDMSNDESGTSPNNQYNSHKNSKRTNLSSAGHQTFTKRSSKRNVGDKSLVIKVSIKIILLMLLSDEDDDKAMKHYLKKKNEMKAKQRAEEDEEKQRHQDEMRQKLEANEVPRNPEKEQRQFIDEMFGKDFPTSSK